MKRPIGKGYTAPHTVSREARNTNVETLELVRVGSRTSETPAAADANLTIDKLRQYLLQFPIARNENVVHGAQSFFPVGARHLKSNCHPTAMDGVWHPTPFLVPFPPSDERLVSSRFDYATLTTCIALQRSQ